jgi:hypothetical protein
MIGHRIGGTITFGGGLALYTNKGTTAVGGIGLSGDTACAIIPLRGARATF